MSTILHFELRAVLRKAAGRRWKTRILLPALAACLAALFPIVSAAQTPAPTSFMKDVNPGQAYPSGAGVVVVEGTAGASTYCSNDSTLTIERATTNFLAANRYTLTEITPQKACAPPAKITYYENLLKGIANHIEKYGRNPASHWLGFMLDEESGFGFSVRDLEKLNRYVTLLMLPEPGYSWWFSENFPNGSDGDWTVSQYGAIAGPSWAAPQVYNSYMVSFINRYCRRYLLAYRELCINDVTAYPSGPYPYPYNNGPADARRITGAPYKYGFRGPGYYNLFQR